MVFCLEVEPVWQCFLHKGRVWSGSSWIFSTWRLSLVWQQLIFSTWRWSLVWQQLNLFYLEVEPGLAAAESFLPGGGAWSGSSWIFSTWRWSLVWQPAALLPTLPSLMFNFFSAQSLGSKMLAVWFRFSVIPAQDTLLQIVPWSCDACPDLNGDNWP